jgi:hypothetical protein
VEVVAAGAWPELERSQALLPVPQLTLMELARVLT